MRQRSRNRRSVATSGASIEPKQAVAMKHGQRSSGFSPAFSGYSFVNASDDGATKENVIDCSHRGLLVKNVLLSPNMLQESQRFSSPALASTGLSVNDTDATSALSNSKSK